MKHLPTVLGAFLALVPSVLASTPLVRFDPSKAGAKHFYLEAVPDLLTSSHYRIDFDETTPIFAGAIPIYGGISLVNSGESMRRSFVRLHDNSPASWPWKPSLFIFSATTGSTVNTLNAVFLWKRENFLTGGQNANFDATSQLSLRITDWSPNSASAQAGIRFVVKDGAQYFISEAKAAGPGTFVLSDFNNNGATGKRWAPYNPTATAFEMPLAPAFQAVAFRDVQAVGFIGMGQRHWGTLFAVDSFVATGSVSDTAMGTSMNVSSINDWTMAQPFSNVFQATRGWQTRNAESVGGRNPWHSDLSANIPVDANGWPTTVPFSQPFGNGVIHPNYRDPSKSNFDPAFLISTRQIVHTTVSTQIGGVYRIRFRGTGSFRLLHSYNGSTHVESFDPARIARLPVDASGKRFFDTLPISTVKTANEGNKATISLEITKSGRAEYLREFEYLPPGTQAIDWLRNPFTPGFVTSLSGYKTLRTMGMGRTNGSRVERWSQRTRPSTYTQTVGTGAALEYMIKLANATGSHLWISLPHRANEEYIRKTARLIRYGGKADGEPFDPTRDARALKQFEPLNPALKVMVEYSNETWNTEFAQAEFCMAEGERLRATGLPFSANRGLAGHQYTAYRSAQAWGWFNAEFGADAPDRVVRVLASQAVSPSVSAARLGAFEIEGLIGGGEYPDVLSIAPYFGFGVADQLDVASATTASILARARSQMEGPVTVWVAEHKALADKYDVLLNCYEGGQHLVGTEEAVENAALTAKLIAANRDPAMKRLYQDYLNMLNDAGVADFAHWCNIDSYSKWGSWGIQEYLGQPLSQAFKLQALLKFKAANPQSNQPPTLGLTGPESVVDTNGNGVELLKFSADESRDYDGTIREYRWTANGQSIRGRTASFTLPVGEHTVTLTAEDDDGAANSVSTVVAVRPSGADSVILQSSFAGAAAPGLSVPWTSTVSLSAAVTQSGWSFPRRTGPQGIIGGSSATGALGVWLAAGNVSRTTLADAIANNQYLKLVVSPQPGRSLDLRGGSIDFTIRCVDQYSARRVAVTTNLSGFTETDAIGISEPLASSSAGTDNPLRVHFPFADAYRDVRGPLEIRIYLFDNIYHSKQVQFSAFKLSGAVR